MNLLFFLNVFLYFLLFRSHWDVWCFWKSRHLESFLPFLVSQMACPKKPPGKTLTQWRIDDDIHDMWSENHMDIKLAFVVLLFFGLQHFNTQSWSNTVYLWKWSIWETYPFGLQYAKNTWSLLHVHGVQIGKDGALNMNLTLIQNRQWDSTTKSWTKDLLHRRTGYHNLWVLNLKTPDTNTGPMHPRYDRYDLDEGLVTMGESNVAQAHGGHDAVVRAQQRRFGRTRTFVSR